MGAVWVARHLQLDIDVALKLMKPTYAANAGWRARFEREARSAAQLRHPNVVQVYDYGVDEDVPYIAMELLAGEALDTRLRRERRLSPMALLPIVTQVCKGLLSAHEAGFVHRDLKPGNIFLVQRSGEEEVAKILDFGIAKAVGPDSTPEATETGMLLGSPYYMSPEQARNIKQLDHRSDLWSLGVIVFRCLTGRLPFEKGEMINMLVDICTAPIPVASEIIPDYGPALDLFLQRALMRDPKARYQSALEFAEAFAHMAQPNEGTLNIWTAPAPRRAPTRLLVTVSGLVMLAVAVVVVVMLRHSVFPSSPVAQTATAMPASQAGVTLAPSAATTPAAPLTNPAPPRSPAPAEATSRPVATGAAAAATARSSSTSAAGASRKAKSALPPAAAPRPTTPTKKDDLLNDM